MSLQKFVALDVILRATRYYEKILDFIEYRIESLIFVNVLCFNLACSGSFSFSSFFFTLW